MPASSFFNQVKARNNIDYMLRSTQQHHIQLSVMADQKAHILLGVAAIILTLVLGNYKKEDVQVWSLILGAFVFLSAIFALLAITPRLKKEKFQQPNWLFFAAFAPLEPEQYMQKMAEIMQDDALVYTTIVNEIHQLGRLLQFHKFRYLRHSYELFLAGLVLAVVAWIIERVAA